MVDRVHSCLFFMQPKDAKEEEKEELQGILADLRQKAIDVMDDKAWIDNEALDHAMVGDVVDNDEDVEEMQVDDNDDAGG